MAAIMSNDKKNCSQRTLCVDDFQFHSESEKQWSARRRFIIKHVAEYEAKNKIDQLLSLSMVWANHVFLGCRYGPDLMKKVLEMAEGIDVGEKPNFQLVDGEAKKRSTSCDSEEPFKKILKFGSKSRFEPVRFVASSSVDEKENESKSATQTSHILPVDSASIAVSSPQNTTPFVFDPWASNSASNVPIHSGGDLGCLSCEVTADRTLETQQGPLTGTEAPTRKQLSSDKVKARQQKTTHRGLGFGDQEGHLSSKVIVSSNPSISSKPRPVSLTALNEGQRFIDRLSSAIAATLKDPKPKTYCSILSRSLQACKSSPQYVFVSLNDISPRDLPKDLTIPCDGYACELRCQSMHLAASYALTKKSARKQASKKAVKLLQAPVEVRVVQRRQKCKYFNDLLVCQKHCPTPQLAPALSDPDDKSAPSGQNRWSDFEIVENAPDAIGILSNSAVHSRMKIEYRFDQLSVQGIWQCCVYLEDQLVAQAKGQGKKVAKYVAAEAALRKLRQYQAAKQQQHLNELVILENCQTAVGIINNTAQFNGVSVDYKLTQVNGEHWKCELYLDGQFVVEGMGLKKSVKQIAAEKALSMLRQKHVVVRIKSLTKDGGDSISREQISGHKAAEAAQQPIKEDNIGNQLLRKMGWSGGGLGREGEGIAEPIKVKEQFRRDGLGLDLNKSGHELNRRELEDIILKYAVSDRQDELRFSAELDNAERKKVHELCHKYNLRSKSYGRGAQRFLVVGRKMQREQLIGRLLRDGQVGRYELVKPQA